MRRHTTKAKRVAPAPSLKSPALEPERKTRRDEKAEERAYAERIEAARKERKLKQLYDLQDRVHAVTKKCRGLLNGSIKDLDLRMCADMIMQEPQTIVDCWIRLAIQDLDGDRLSQEMADRAIANRAACR